METTVYIAQDGKVRDTFTRAAITCGSCGERPATDIVGDKALCSQCAAT